MTKLSPEYGAVKGCGGYQCRVQRYLTVSSKDNELCSLNRGIIREPPLTCKTITANCYWLHFFLTFRITPVTSLEPTSFFNIVIPGIHLQTLIVTLDRIAYDAIGMRWPNIKRFHLEVPCLKVMFSSHLDGRLSLNMSTVYVLTS